MVIRDIRFVLLDLRSTSPTDDPMIQDMVRLLKCTLKQFSNLAAVRNKGKDIPWILSFLLVHPERVEVRATMLTSYRRASDQDSEGAPETEQV
jgi:hypothetical protein